MPDAIGLTAEQILAIPADRPERLFTGARGTLQAEFRALAKLWHPDLRQADPKATDVFARLGALHSSAERLLDGGAWPTPGAEGVMELALASGKVRRRAYRRAHPLDGGASGRAYVGDLAVTFAFEPGSLDLATVGERTVAELRYADARMEAKVRPRLPKVSDASGLADGGRVITLTKTKDVLILRDVLGHFGGRMDARHVAWIVSDLLDLCCYLGWAGLTHNAISPDTAFVSPHHHAVSLLGGWHFAAPVGGPLAALPEGAADIADPAILAAKRADPRLDLDMVRATGRELLGDPRGTTLRRDASVPAAMADWLCGASRGDAVADATAWRAALERGFGRRTFFEMNLTADDLYGEASG